MDHCKKAAEWVQENKNLFTGNIKIPSILHMDSESNEEATRDLKKGFDTTCALPDEERETI